MKLTIEQYLQTCTVSAVHLEMRDGYMQNDPDYDAWKNGYHIDPGDRRSWWRPWLQNIVDATSRGVKVRRVRIVSEPLSQYIRYEYDVTFPNIRAGEEIRWLSRRKTSDLALPGNDFWLFDERLLLITHFSGEGDVVDRELSTDVGLIKHASDAFESVWRRAVPHEKYRPAQ
ncbi:DUF6879 family protein [Sphaerisporangium sp. NPDC051011]|uniref:DUF6879 family protein n=1 Tax=Sphaerisporangium sp. NPDC051011 TaxID=3155792 RepID=UPI0033E8004A